MVNYVDIGTAYRIVLLIAINELKVWWTLFLRKLRAEKKLLIIYRSQCCESRFVTSYAPNIIIFCSSRNYLWKILSQIDICLDSTVPVEGRPAQLSQKEEGEGDTLICFLSHLTPMGVRLKQATRKNALGQLRCAPAGLTFCHSN